VVVILPVLAPIGRLATTFVGETIANGAFTPPRA
jgi:hypothetical protein